MRPALVKMLALAVWALAITSGCILQSGTAPDVEEGGPGARPGELACKSDGDCRSGESCTEGICQMKRCGEAKAYRSAPPLGVTSTFLYARDLVAASAGAVEGYTPRDGTFTRANTPPAPVEGTVVDVAGGNLLGTRPEAFAVATAGSSRVRVQQGNNAFDLDVGFVPIALAAGDTDGDGVDELVAAAANGTYAVCRAPQRECTRHALGGKTIVDLAMGDVDADGFAEPVFLAGSEIITVNLDADTTSQQKTVVEPAGHTLTRLASGDLDGDEVDEIIGIEQGSWLSGHDNLHVYSIKSGKLTARASSETASGVRDVSVVQSGEQRGRIAVLRASSAVEMLALAGDAISSEYTSRLASSDVIRLASADVDGDSPIGRLKGDPRVVSGPSAPIAVIAPPPYSQRYSAGPSKAMLGSTETKGETESSSVALSMSLSVSAEFDLFGLVNAGVNAHVDAQWSKTRAFNKSLTVGQSFFFAADPEQNGYDSAGVVVGCGCFLQFDYEVDDPGHALGGDAHGKTMSVLVPVGGQTTLWSTRRYNALAKALGNLPTLRMPYRLGDVASYPKEARTLAGKPVPGEDLVFPNPPSFRVSDSATVMFSLNQETAEVNGRAATLGFGGGGKVGAGITVSVDVSRAATKSYELRVARGTTFAGFVEPIKNDLKTPEDEFTQNAYSFTPYVYRERYQLNGEDAGLFVLMYSVGR